MDAVPLHQSVITGPVKLRRVAYFGFPKFEVAGADGMVAQLGRNSSLNIFFGRGRRVRLADGTELRIKSTTAARHIVPIVTCNTGTLVISGPLHAERSYGINGKDYAYTLTPLGRVGPQRARQWALRRLGETAATVDELDDSVHPVKPIPVPVVLMAYVLISHGIPGEADLTPQPD